MYFTANNVWSHQTQYRHASEMITTPGITYTNKATTIYASTQGVWLYSNTNVSWEVFLLRKSAPVVEEGEKKMKIY